MKNICLCIFVLAFLLIVGFVLAKDTKTSFGSDLSGKVIVDIYSLSLNDLEYFSKKKDRINKEETIKLKRISSNEDYQHIKISFDYLKYRFKRTNEKWLMYEILFKDQYKYQQIILKEKNILIVINSSYYEILSYNISDLSSNPCVRTNRFTSEIIRNTIGENYYNQIIEEIKNEYPVR